MEVSMWMLYDALSSECARHNLDDRSKRLCIKGIMPYLGPENLTDNYLYVADATGDTPLVLPSEPCYLAVAGDNFVQDERGQYQYIVLRPEYRFCPALSAAIKAFEKYSDWCAALQDELNGGQNLNRLCQLGTVMLGNYTMLYDRVYTIIAGEFVIDGEVTHRYEEKNGPYFALSAPAIRQLKSNASFRQTFSQSGAAVCKVDFLPYDVLYVNLAHSDVYEGRLCVTEELRPFRNGDYQIAEILTEFIRIALKRRAVRSSDESRKFEAFVLKMLDGAVPGDEALDAALSLWHWKRFGRYAAVRIQQNETDTQTSSDVYLVTKLAQSLPGACAIRYQDGIVCLISLQAKETARDAAVKLSTLRDFIPNIGVSDVYTDFKQTAQFYRQAVVAAEMGAQNNWCSYFRDYAMAHYFMNGTSVLPAIHFCDEDVKILMAYQDSRTDYYNTLKVYLENNMNLLETSKALFIHRTTLFNRIGRIRELISADLNNPEDRTRMLISFKLMEADRLYGRG